MKQSTRTALALGPAAPDAQAAAALDKGKHNLTLRELEKSDPELVSYLRREYPDTYTRLFQAQYGKAPAGPTTIVSAPTTPGYDPEKARQARTALANLGPNVTMRQLEREHPDLVVQLRQQAPEVYQRLYMTQYGKLPDGQAPVPAQQKLARAVAEAVCELTDPSSKTPATTSYAYRSKEGEPPIVLRMGQYEPEIAAQLPTDLANDSRFERAD